MPAVEDASAPGETVLKFQLGAAGYALPIGDVVEVVPEAKVTPLPGAPPEVAGLLLVRGEIRPVYHLPPLLGVADSPAPAAGAAVLLLRTSRGEAGILADGVGDLAMVKPGERIPSPAAQGHAGWLTPDFFTVLAIGSLIEGN